MNYYFMTNKYKKSQKNSDSHNIITEKGKVVKEYPQPPVIYSSRDSRQY